MMSNKTTFSCPLLIFLSLIIFVACSPPQSVVQTAIAQTEALYTPTPENTITPTITFTPKIDETPTPIVTETALPMVNTKTVKKLTSLGETITIQNYSHFLIESIKFRNVVLPPNTSGYYRYYEAPSGATFMVIIATVKNLSSIIRSVDDLVEVNLNYDNQYYYSSEALLVDNDGEFTTLYGLSPLLSGQVYYLLQVPKEMESSSKSIIITFRSHDVEFIYHFR